jgi:hypothetical protein
MPAIVFGETVKVDTPEGGGTVDITETEKPPPKGKDTFKTTVVVKNNSKYGSFTVKKTLPGTGLGVTNILVGGNPATGATVKEQDGSTTITLPVTGSQNFTFETTKQTQGKDKTNKIQITVGDKTSESVDEKTQSGTGGKLTPKELPPKGGAKTKTTESVTYNAATSVLSFENDVVAATGFPGDPLIGASVDLPKFKLDGFTPDGDFAVFTVNSNDLLTIHRDTDVYSTAGMASLYYNIAGNYFGEELFDLSLSGVDASSPFYDPHLAFIDSPFLGDLDALLNPNSPQYDASLRPYFNFVPDDNFYDLTNGFATSWTSGGEDGHFASQPTPEPSTLIVWSLLGASGVGIGSWRRRKAA